MSELQDMLRVQARLHRKQGANALGDLFQSAALEIEILTERLENPQGLQELICVEQMKEISLPEIHRANQKLHEQLAKANEEITGLKLRIDNQRESLKKQYSRNDIAESELAKANERLKELEQELKESDDDLYVTQQQSSNYESALEEIQAIFVDSDACPLFEPFNPKNLSAWLNKFAIEKKVEGVKGFVKSFKFLDDAHCVNIIEVRDAASHYIEEQLRKGGES